MTQYSLCWKVWIMSNHWIVDWITGLDCGLDHWTGLWTGLLDWIVDWPVCRVTLKVGMRKLEMENEEMRKWEEGQFSKLLAFLFLQSSNVMRVIYWEIIYALQLAPKGYAKVLHHDLQASSMYFTFGTLFLIPTLSESWRSFWIWVSSPSMARIVHVADCSRKPKCIFNFSAANYYLKLHKALDKGCSAWNQTILQGITSSYIWVHISLSTPPSANMCLLMQTHVIPRSVPQNSGSENTHWPTNKNHFYSHSCTLCNQYC